MNRPIRHVYVCMDGASSVIESQVVDLLHSLHSMPDRPNFDLLLMGRRSDVLARKSSLFMPERRGEIEAKIGGRLMARTFTNSLHGFFLALFFLFQLCFPKCFSSRLILQGRSKDGAFMAAIFKLLCLGRPRLIYDQRGDNVAEFLYSLPPRNRSRLTLRQRISLFFIHFMEWLGIKFSNRILYVTEHLRSVVERRYKRAKSKPSAVFPCLADAEKIQWRPDKRTLIRERLNVGDEHIMLTYGGSLDKYQCLDEMLALFGEMRKQNHLVIMLFMTNVINHEAIEGRLKRIADPEFWRIIEVHHKDISDYLSAGDLGLLLREPSPVNESAAPTKFAEYVMSGLPIIVSSGIGDYSGLASEKNWGVVWDDLNKIDELAKACLEWMEINRGVDLRERIALEAREHLSRQSRINDYRAFLRLDN